MNGLADQGRVLRKQRLRATVTLGVLASLIAGGSYLAAAGPYDVIPTSWYASAAASSGGDSTSAPTTPPASPPTRAPEPECDPYYPGLCIPPVTYNGDLDCDDLMAEGFRVIPPDPHGFDDDNDGIGCEQDVR